MDTSALFSAIWSEEGGARMILKLGEAGALQIVIGPQVLAEIDEVLRRKHPEALPALAKLLDRCRVEVTKVVTDEILQRCRLLISHPGDAHVLAEAWCAGVVFFVTHDQQHLSGNPALLKGVPFAVGSPGDYLAWYRSKLLGDDPD